jgi:hypothetical protein
LRDGNYRAAAVSVDESRGRLVIRRGAVLVACNLDQEPARFDTGGSYRLVLASAPAVSCQSSIIHLPPESVAVLEHLAAEVS